MEPPAHGGNGSNAVISGTPCLFSTDAEKFNALAEAWNDHHIGLATLDFNHPAYHQIIGMGRTAVPFLLERLQRREVGWIYALKCISGEQAAPLGTRGGDAIDAWLNWGRRQGFAIG